MQANKNVNESLNLLLVLVTLLGGLLLAGCEGRELPSPPRPVPEVATVNVRPQRVELTIELPGRTAPFRIAEIRPQVSGLILKRLFEEGSDVTSGQVLYQIDPAPFQAALDNARAAFDRSEANRPAVQLRVDRYKEALADKAVSQQDFDDANAALKQTEADIQFWKAALETARINLGYCRITAPISGRIGKSTVTEGAIVTAYQPAALATIQQLDPIYVDVPQSTTELLRLKQRLESGHLNHGGTNQNRIRLILEEGTTYPREGTLQFRDVSVDPSTGSVILRMVFPNPEGILLPEMYVRAVVKEGINEEAILIPQQAVLRTPKGEPLALIVDKEGKVHQRMLTLDRAIGDKWLVSTGLTFGDQVIVEGLQSVRPEMLVKVVPFQESGTRHESEAGSEPQPKKQPAGGD